MIRRVFFTALLVVLSTGAEAEAQAPGQAETSIEATVSPDAFAQAGDIQAGELPLRAAPPRTMRAYWHVFIAFAVTWALLFGYAITVGRRFGRLEDELKRLRG